MSFFVMPHTFTVMGRFKMVQRNMPLSSIAPYICTFLKRPCTGLCFGHLTKKDIHMPLKPARHREASAEADGQFGDFNPLEAD